MKTSPCVIAVLSAFFLLLCACQKAPQITVSTPLTLDMSVDGSSGAIAFMANRDWTVSCSESWIHVNPTSGPASKKNPVTVNVQCDANPTYDDRTATVSIRAGDAVQTVTVKQPQKPGIVVPTQSFEIKADTKSIEVEVQANTDYIVSVSVDWIKEAGTKALTSKTYLFNIEENTGYDDRAGRITIFPNDASIATQVISVKQAAKAGLEVKNTEYEMKVDGGTIEVAVKTNVELEVKPEVDWIHFAETKALSNKTVVLTVDKNEGSERRTGKVTIRQKNGSLSSTISVMQYSLISGGVDMGLSVNWAECNLGARTPEGYGDYYAWGEIEVKDQYLWSNYKWALNDDNKTITKYCPSDQPEYWGGSGSPDGKTVLDPEDDVAHVRMGGKWRIPTDGEWMELWENCTWTWTAQNGTFGRLIVSNINGNSIFLPATEVIGSVGHYWTSTVYPLYSNGTWFGWFTSDTIGRGIGKRSEGKTIRPVTD